MSQKEKLLKEFQKESTYYKVFTHSMMFYKDGVESIKISVKIILSELKKLKEEYKEICDAGNDKLERASIIKSMKDCTNELKSLVSMFKDLQPEYSKELANKMSEDLKELLEKISSDEDYDFEGE